MVGVYFLVDFLSLSDLLVELGDLILCFFSDFGEICL